MSQNFLTYMHIRESDGLVFYIGKGTRRRACATSGRSEHWARVKAKHGCRVEVCAEWPSEAEAFEHEIFLIDTFRSLGHPLVNVCDGGQGVRGSTWDEARRQIRSELLRSRPDWLSNQASAAKATMANPAHALKIASARDEHFSLPENRAAVGRRLKSYWSAPENKQRMLSRLRAQAADPERRISLSRSKGGAPFVHVETGVIYQTQCEASRATGTSQGLISGILSGKKSAPAGRTFRPINGKGESQ